VRRRAPPVALTAPVPVYEPVGCPRCGAELCLTLFSGTDRLYRTTEKRFTIVECSDCGLLRLKPMPDPEELKTFYPEQYWWEADNSIGGRLGDLYRRFVLNDHVKFVTSAMEAPGPVLDIGCGGGLLVEALSDQGYGVLGADTSVKAAQVCLNRAQVPAVCASLPHLPFREQSFGGVTMFHVLEHLYDPFAAIEAATHLLAPGGRLVIQTPNADCWQLMLLGQHWSGLDIPRHLYDFRAEDLEALLAGCGFEVRRVKRFSLRDNPAGLATSFFPQLEPVARRARRVNEGPALGLLKNAIYLALTVAAVPFAVLEAAGGAGSTVMIEAARAGEE